MTSTEIEEFISKFGEDAYKKIYNCAFNLGRKRRMDMKAPDKIYTDNRGVYAELPIFSQIDANVEYILKDALLEWLEEMKFLFNDKEKEWSVETSIVLEEDGK